MVVVKTVDNRWIRRYKIFFIIGTIIFTFQLFLAIRFFTLQADSVNLPNSWNEDAEVSVNSAKRSNNAVVIDDEEGVIKKAAKLPTVVPATPKHVAKLRLEELDFVPACEISTKEAVSAIHRAKTQKCKQEIANITCLIQRGELYPSELPNFCPHEGQDAGKLLGCYKDEKNFRLLSGYYGKNKNGNSPEYCIRLCLQSGFAYAGVQYSIECFCGNDEPPSSAKLPDSSCNMKCPSDSQQICGGYFTTNIFQTGIKKFSPRIASTGSTNIKQVRIVFLLTLNGRALRQVKRLIKILYHKDHYFYIHVDARQDYLFRELLSLERQFSNVRLTRHRFATIWGGASLLKMLRSAMRELIHDTDWKWDFIINLSESDYPVKTLDRLTTFLTLNKDKNFVKSHGREVQRFIQKQGLDKTFIECDTHMWRTGDRKIPWGIQIDGGSDWVALSRKFVEYIATDTPDELVEGLLVVFTYTLLPAESFFHTVLRNSKFCNTYIDNNLHVTNWKRKLGCKCQYKHIVDWCGCSPNDFKPEDWLRIQNTESRQIYFARKFEPIINQAVVLQLEQWLYGDSYHTDLLNIHSYWQSVYNSFDLGTNGDDSLLTLADSLIRSTIKTLNKHCNAAGSKLKEIHSYHTNDSYQRTLVLYEVNVSDVGSVMLETWFKPKNTLLLTKSSNIVYRIKSMLVSSEYDQKEQISRNFVRSLGPYSEPVLIYSFNAAHAASKTTNLTLLWINPAGHLVDVTEISVDDMFVIGFSKPSLKQPLLPGAWTIKLVHHEESAAEVKFLITPLSFVGGNTISQNQVNFIHSGADNFKEFDVSLEKYLPSNFERERLELLSVANSKRFGPDLQEWIDSLFAKFYTSGSSCLLRNVNVCGIPVDCTETSWSSFAPDPKSYIGKVNETTGGLN